MRYSIIVPVYNRPLEIDDLLMSLTNQTFQDFEVLVIEDGSTELCQAVVNKYRSELKIRYFKKENSGQGFSRNYGFKKAKGDYLVVFDSDCLIPPHYFESVNSRLAKSPLDCWGGPDKAHSEFTSVQKAINYSMTSIFTTGGIRGSSGQPHNYLPRSFNMGISREVYEKTGGYRITRMGEDLEFSVRIKKEGFTAELIDDAFVYHKRRTDLKQFFKQLFFFGRARINLARYHPEQITLLHTLPLLFSIGLILSLFTLLFAVPALRHLIFLYLLFALIIAVDSYKKEKDIKVSFLSVPAAFIQLTGYGLGFGQELLQLNRSRSWFSVF